MLSTIVIIFGLALFEVISSVDNAIVNAHILSTLPDKYKKFFTTWGLVIAVVMVRGLLPFIILFLAKSGHSIDSQKPILLLGGGVYLFLVFLSWFFMEEKKYAFLVEGFIHRQSMWFYAISSIALTAVVYFSLRVNPALALSASIGATAFFITDGFKKNAEEKEKDLLSPALSAISKILFLEILDASFSIDGVVGAFAFTLSVPLILLGNGLGALIVREFTVRGIDTITRFAYLKNGAMYSIGSIGVLMVLEAFGGNYPFWLAPLNTFILLGVFLFLSIREIEDAKKAQNIK